MSKYARRQMSSGGRHFRPTYWGKHSRARRPAWRDTLVVACGVLIAIALMTWPWLLDQLDAGGAQNKVTEVTSQVEAMPQKQREALLAQAQMYNDQLAGKLPEDAQAEVWPYREQLSYNDEPMMSWLEIPSINVDMPIYHGTSDSALMAGVGHLEGTSLPVGGTGTHTVLTAHSGMQNLTMFDDIGKLEPGDLVLLHTLGETLAYRMESSEVVWPDEVSGLAIETGKDQVTLVTCTPYGINDHRLLVHCARSAYDGQLADEQHSPLGRHWGMREWAVLVSVMAALAFVLWMLVRRLKRRRRPYVAKHRISPR